jgi:hypothetical protein
MVDLSRVLGDVYAHSDEAAARATAQLTDTEDWSNDARLDEAFRRWRPGPPLEAPAAERMFAAGSLAPAPSSVVDDRHEVDELGEVPADDLLVAYVPGTPAAAFHGEGLAPHVIDAALSGAALLGPADGLSDAVADAFAEAVAAEMSGRPRWTRDHDDILPAGKRGRGGLRFRRR